MASIDKIYSKQVSFKEYTSFLEWCKNEGNVLFHKHCSYGKSPYNIGLYESKPYQLEDFIYLYDEQTYNKEVPLCNLPEAINIFLIRHLPKSFEDLHNALNDMYGIDYINITNGTSLYDKHIPRNNNGKIGIIKNTFIHNYICTLQQPLDIQIHFNVKDYIHCLWYNTMTDEWFDDTELMPIDSDTATVKITSYKALINKIKKWNLPLNVVIEISGKNKGNNATFFYK